MSAGSTESSRRSDLHRPARSSAGPRASASTVDDVRDLKVQLDRTGGITAEFVVPDQPSLVLRRLELLLAAAWRHDVSASVFRAEFPADTAYPSGGGAVVGVEVTGSAHRSSLRLSVRPVDAVAPAVVPPPAAYRSELRHALAELLDERTARTARRQPTAALAGTTYWALSLCTVLGLGEQFLLSLRDTGLRPALLGRWTPSWRTKRPVTVVLAAAVVLGALWGIGIVP